MKFTYEAESRTMPDGTIRQFVVCREHSFELWPTFEAWTTAAEIAAKITRGDEGCNNIPAVPYGTAVPRPSTAVFVPAKGRTAPAPNQTPRRVPRG